MSLINQPLSPRAKVIASSASVVLILVALYVVVSYFRGGDADSQNYTMYICSETGKRFRHKNEMGDTLPLLSPYSGKNTAVPAEACYWTRDGKTKQQPTWVLVNEFIGKHEATFCPDCGRRVVGHNPPPLEGMNPPLTQDEYTAQRAARSAEQAAREDER